MHAGLRGFHAAPPVLLHPLKGAGRRSSGFGQRTDPITGKPSFHDAVDYAAARGTPVYAAAPGRVVRVDRDGEGRGVYNGNAVVLAHADLSVQSTAYLHLDRSEVRVGQRVRAGDRIGTVGSTGRSTGPHLHFMAYQAGQPVDPEPLIAPVGALLPGVAGRAGAEARSAPPSTGTPPAARARWATARTRYRWRNRALIAGGVLAGGALIVLLLSAGRRSAQERAAPAA